MDSPLTLGNVKFKTISTPNRYVEGPFVDFEIQVVGASDWQGVSTGDHHLRITFGSQTVDEVFEGYQLRKINRSFSPTELSPANNLIRFESIDDLNVGVDRTALAYMKIRYPQSLSLSNANYYEFYLEDANLQSAQYLELLSFNGGPDAILYDLSNRKKIRVIESLSNHRMIVPSGRGLKKCVILNKNEVKMVSKISPVEGTGTFTNHAANISDTAFLVISHTDLLVGASNYTNYRQSQGTYSALVDIETLYDQYAYGISKHPMSIRNFVNQVEFEAINRAMVTNMLNYPNPFSTSTRFVFTLTGSEIPQEVQIQIMTVTGKVVQEIDEMELGPLRIGNNMTEFAWDGKDEFGDQLANGVYLYRVKMKLNGTNIDRRESSVDKSFVRNFGKMYLLR